MLQASHLPHDRAAEVIAALSAEQQLAVIRRIAAMGPTDPEVIEDVARTLERRLAHVVPRRDNCSGGVPRVAEILHAGDRAIGFSVLANLGQDDPVLADAIRDLLYVFDDLLRFSDADVQTIAKQIDCSQWALALKGASEELRQKVLVNLPKRTAARLSETISQLGPVRLSAVERARRQIVDVIRRLEEVGAIRADSAFDRDEFVI